MDRAVLPVGDAVLTAIIIFWESASIIMKGTQDIVTVATIVLTTMAKPEKSTIPIVQFAMVMKRNTNNQL